MAEWRAYEADTPQCTHCGMWMPFARYRRGQGTDARKITDFCPSCGKVRPVTMAFKYTMKGKVMERKGLL